ncbi:MAG: Ribosome-binding factor A [uncultured Thiotrichaceae bacterium]|uniref:Ribosome-binding factor A n=1 Tax=uncultured Thiotrichaceae bacterium TaxID=298394 RepID=A0A6S6S9E2_9GAMM|nr:MAG: Ribosome-binding factor A [uncultured Thiotrichaceae bacterium]
MPIDYARTDRISEQIKRVLAQLIRDKVKDPRIGMISILDVEVTKDLKMAKVYFDTFQTDKVDDSTIGLNRAAGFLRRELAKELSLRSTPSLQFLYDDTEIKANDLSALIDKAVASDKDPS